MSFVSNEHFNVLVYPDGSYVGIDNNYSGGYPYPTISVLRGHLWSKTEESQNSHAFKSY